MHRVNTGKWIERVTKFLALSLKELVNFLKKSLVCKKYRILADSGTDDMMIYRCYLDVAW